jgi:hypothetical protein
MGQRLCVPVARCDRIAQGFIPGTCRGVSFDGIVAIGQPLGRVRLAEFKIDIVVAHPPTAAEGKGELLTAGAPSEAEIMIRNGRAIP